VLAYCCSVVNDDIMLSCVRFMIKIMTGKWLFMPNRNNRIARSYVCERWWELPWK